MSSKRKQPESGLLAQTGAVDVSVFKHKGTKIGRGSIIYLNEEGKIVAIGAKSDRKSDTLIYADVDKDGVAKIVEGPPTTFDRQVVTGTTISPSTKGTISQAKFDKTRLQSKISKKDDETDKDGTNDGKIKHVPAADQTTEKPTQERTPEGEGGTEAEAPVEAREKGDKEIVGQPSRARENGDKEIVGQPSRKKQRTGPGPGEGVAEEGTATEGGEGTAEVAEGVDESKVKATTTELENVEKNDIEQASLPVGNSTLQNVEEVKGPEQKEDTTGSTETDTRQSVTELYKTRLIQLLNDPTSTVKDIQTMSTMIESRVASEIEKTRKEQERITNENAEKQTAVQVEETKKNVDSFTNRAAAGELDGNTIVGDAMTGLTATVTTANTVDVQSHLNTNKSDDRGTVNMVVDGDKKNSNKNNINDTVMTELYNTQTALTTADNAASGNTFGTPAETSLEMEVTHTTRQREHDIREGEKRAKSLLKGREDASMEGVITEGQIEDAKAAENKTHLNDIRTTAKATTSKIRGRLHQKLISEQRVYDAQSVERERAEVGGGPGFETHIKNLHRLGFIKDLDSPEERRREMAVLRKMSKVTNASKDMPGGDVEALLLREQRDKSRTELLKSGVEEAGSPIFFPNESISKLHDAQKQVVMRLTQDEALEIQKEIAPHWHGYQLYRLDAGRTEMESMPTRLLHSGASQLKIGSKIRTDMTQRENSFGDFMFYMLRVRDQDKVRTWRRFLTWSAALGYNNLTIAQINFMVTANPNGDLHDKVNLSRLLEDQDQSALDEPIDVIGGVTWTMEDIHTLNEIVSANPEPLVQYPSRSTHPSAPPVDNSTHKDNSTSVSRQQRTTLAGITSRVEGIPDPRFSKRGGERVENVREITIRNPKWDPKQKKKPGEEGYEEKFIQQEVPDVGVGAKDVLEQESKDMADRLLSGQPVKLYAPIHPNACDRYLGAKNYRRLTMATETYFQKFSGQGFNIEDIETIYTWNAYVLSLYGPTWYAFVTDIDMQRTTPVFDPSTPDAVRDEYMELNELVEELTNFQNKIENRIEREGVGEVRDAAEETREFLRDTEDDQKQKLMDANAMIISFPQDRLPPGAPEHVPGEVPDQPPRPGDVPDDAPDQPNRHAPEVQIGGLPMKARMMDTSPVKSTLSPLIGAKEMDYGITRRPLPLFSSKPSTDSVTVKRNRMFDLLGRR